MKNLLFLLVISIALGCHESSDWSNVVYNEEDGLIPEQLWKRDSIAPLNDHIISFDFDWATVEQENEIGSGLATYYDKSEKLPKHTDINIDEYKDSVVVTFWKNEVLSCGMYGNAEVKDNSVNLYVGNICSPYEVPTDGELALLHFKFVFKNEVEIATKKFAVKNIDEKRLSYN